MTFTYLMELLGGLALFLYGMQMMSTGLEAAAGNKMKVILEKLTSNRFVGVLVGALITAVIQSSSATTVMVVGFVNSVNIAGYSKMITKKKIDFSEQANKEIMEMQRVCKKIFELLSDKTADFIAWHEKVACMEQKIDDMTIQYRDNMYERIKQGKCSDEGSILFSEMLTDFERIGDHALNISNEMLKIAMIEKKGNGD